MPVISENGMPVGFLLIFYIVGNVESGVGILLDKVIYL
jgi:hypothetical protein